MLYQIKSDTVLLKIDRAEILDISPDDEIEIPELCNKKYKWKDQDSQFLESNPDAEVFLMFETGKAENLLPVGIVIRS